MNNTFYTIGYEGSSIEDFVETLRQADIDLLVDIRDFPGSRKKGFSKNTLANILASFGIDYIHLKGLGDPKPGREAARAGEHDKFVQIFSEHMRTSEAQTDLEKAIELVQNNKSCLLCYERNHKECHRNIVGNMIKDTTGMQQKHIGVMHGCGNHLEHNQDDKCYAYA